MSIEQPPEVVIVAPAEMQVDDITLRMSQEIDVDEAYRVHDANRAFWATQLDFAADYTLEKARDDRRKAAKQIAAGTLINYGIFYGGQMVGNIGLTFKDEAKAELGYMLAESAQGKGIVRRTAARLLAYGFEERGLRSVELYIKPGNERSQKVAKNLGAHIVGNTDDGKFDIWEVNPHE